MTSLCFVFQFAMLAEAVSDERQEIQAREKAHTKVSLVILIFPSCQEILQQFDLILMPPSDIKQSEAGDEIQDGERDSRAADHDYAG